MEIRSEFTALPEGMYIISVPEKIVKRWSTDQKKCYLLLEAMKSETLSPELASIKCGLINQSRWLTTAQAFIMLWMCHHNIEGETPRKFEVIVKFCVSVYFKQYFEIKVKHNIKYGPEHIVLSLDLLRKLTPEVKDIITP